MRMSKLLAPTLREDPAEAEVVSHKLMLRAGMIRKLAAGIYTLLPLGLRVIQKISQIVREEMNRAGAQEVFMPALLPAELWQETGRWGEYGKELFRIKDRHDREYCLGPTHEEIITDLVRTSITSYRQLPLSLYQIQTKFRDEIRPRFGLMRGREFSMKDCYSFHTSEEDLKREYHNMYQAYCNIFNRIGFKYRVIEAESGIIGGNYSQEYMVLAETGEEEILVCEQCDFAIGWKSFSKEGDKCSKCKKGALSKTRGIEVGHIFQLGIKYSEKMKCVYLDENNKERPMLMGCYGIGIGRIAAAAIEQSHDANGIIWPLSIAPYKTAIIPAQTDNEEQKQAAEKIYKAIGEEALLDDRQASFGIRMKDLDLIGIPYKVIVGKALAEGKIEIKIRSSGETKLVALDKVYEEVS